MILLNTGFPLNVREIGYALYLTSFSGGEYLSNSVCPTETVPPSFLLVVWHRVVRVQVPACWDRVLDGETVHCVLFECVVRKLRITG